MFDFLSRLGGFASATLVIAIILAICAAIGGWVANVFKVVHLAMNFSEDLLVELLVRIVGVPVALIGSIIGWF